MTELEIVPANTNEGFLLCSDIIAPSYVNNIRLPVLRRFCALTPGNKHTITPDRPYYVPITNTFIEDIRLYITDSLGKQISFTDSVVRVTLHLRKNSPFYDS